MCSTVDQICPLTEDSLSVTLTLPQPWVHCAWIAFISPLLWEWHCSSYPLLAHTDITACSGGASTMIPYQAGSYPLLGPCQMWRATTKGILFTLFYLITWFGMRCSAVILCAVVWCDVIWYDKLSNTFLSFLILSSLFLINSTKSRSWRNALITPQWQTRSCPSETDSLLHLLFNHIRGPRTYGWLVLTYRSVGAGCCAVISVRKALRRKLIAGLKRLL